MNLIAPSGGQAMVAKTLPAGKMQSPGDRGILASEGKDVGAPSILLGGFEPGEGWGGGTDETTIIYDGAHSRRLAASPGSQLNTFKAYPISPPVDLSAFSQFTIQTRLENGSPGFWQANLNLLVREGVTFNTKTISFPLAFNYQDNQGAWVQRIAAVDWFGFDATNIVEIIWSLNVIDFAGGLAYIDDWRSGGAQAAAPSGQILARGSRGLVAPAIPAGILLARGARRVIAGSLPAGSLLGLGTRRMLADEGRDVGVASDAFAIFDTSEGDLWVSGAYSTQFVHGGDRSYIVDPDGNSRRDFSLPRDWSGHSGLSTWIHFHRIGGANYNATLILFLYSDAFANVSSLSFPNLESLGMGGINPRVYESYFQMTRPWSALQVAGGVGVNLAAVHRIAAVLTGLTPIPWNAQIRLDDLQADGQQSTVRDPRSLVAPGSPARLLAR